MRLACLGFSGTLATPQRGVASLVRLRRSCAAGALDKNVFLIVVSAAQTMPAPCLNVPAKPSPSQPQKFIMQTIFELKQIKKAKNAVVVLGVFDGVHLAHRQIIKAAVHKARAIGGKSVLVTFWPHPQRQESVYSLEHRLKLIGELGIDVCIVISFNRQFAGIAAKDFVKNILVRRIAAKYIYVGKNFRFGRNAAGDFLLLQKLSPLYNFRLKAFPVIRREGLAVSSTHIRRLIKEGRLKRAGILLGRPVSVLGTVVKGTSLARKLGFPTANIDPHHEVLPPPGVYAVRVVLGKLRFYGACSIGHKPTFNKKSLQHIEVHILNFKKNIYGKYLEIYFIERLRSQRKFASPASLSLQIKKDIFQVRRRFSLT